MLLGKGAELPEAAVGKGPLGSDPGSAPGSALADAIALYDREWAVYGTFRLIPDTMPSIYHGYYFQSPGQASRARGAAPAATAVAALRGVLPRLFPFRLARRREPPGALHPLAACLACKGNVDAHAGVRSRARC